MPQDKVDADATARSKANMKKLAGLVGVGAAAVLLAVVPQFEGVVLHGYKDPIGIPTKCAGDTHNVVVGKKYSAAECGESLSGQLIAHSEPILRCVPQLKGHDGPTVASVSLAYNIGVSAFCRSSAARNFRMGRWEAGCHAIGMWTKAGGKVLPGLVTRRKKEVQICLTGEEDGWQQVRL